MNGLDVATKDLLLETVRQVADDPEVRCVVLTGSGRAFCVGQDLKEHLAGLTGEADVPLSDTVEKHYNPIMLALSTMPKPVIAAVNGVAAGAGASLAFAADFRILVDSAGYNTSFAGVALSCDTGSSWTLPRLVGRAKAMELLYFPRTVSAQEALELGLATQVVAAGRLRRRRRRAGAPAGGRPHRRPSARSARRWPTPPPTRSRSRSPSRRRRWRSPAAPRTTWRRSTPSWPRRSRSTGAADPDRPS